VVQVGSFNPRNDFETVQTEMQLSDLEMQARREKKAKTGGEAELPFLAKKPVLVVVNVSDADIRLDIQELTGKYAGMLKLNEQDIVIMCAKLESELAALSIPEQQEYLADMGVKESGLEQLIRKAYSKLNLISFLTAGEIECRAWTVSQGTTAVLASGVIHTDFMKKFIKADVIPWQDFVRVGGWRKAREAGAVRSEGRDYVVKDGEVVEFKIGN
jgi:ribosome-binding ATPase